MRCSLGNNHHFQSETLRFYASNVIFAMNGSLKYYENIEKYILRCTTIGFKQNYGHKSSRSADMNLWCRSEFGNKSVFRRLQIMRLCYLMPFLFISLHKTPYFTETLERNIESKTQLYFYCWRFLSDCAIVETWIPHGMASLRQVDVGNYMTKYSLPLIFTFYLNRDTLVLELFPVIIIQ